MSSWTTAHDFPLPESPPCPQIVRGAYNPLPTTRSKELRDLIDRMLTLDFNKRPSINDVLATPIVKARIHKFLSATLHVSNALVCGKCQGGCQGVLFAPLATPNFKARIQKLLLAKLHVSAYMVAGLGVC